MDGFIYQTFTNIGCMTILRTYATYGWLEFNVLFQYKYGYIGDEEHMQILQFKISPKLHHKLHYHELFAGTHQRV